MVIFNTSLTSWHEICTLCATQNKCKTFQRNLLQPTWFLVHVRCVQDDAFPISTKNQKKKKMKIKCRETDFFDAIFRFTIRQWVLDCLRTIIRTIYYTLLFKFILAKFYSHKQFECKISHYLIWKRWRRQQAAGSRHQASQEEREKKKRHLSLFEFECHLNNTSAWGENGNV